MMTEEKARAKYPDAWNKIQSGPCATALALGPDQLVWIRRMSVLGKKCLVAKYRFNHQTIEIAQEL